MDKNLEKKIKGFNEEVLPLLGKYKLGIGAQPLILPDGRITAKPIIFDNVKGNEKPEVENSPGDNLVAAD